MIKTIFTALLIFFDFNLFTAVIRENRTIRRLKETILDEEGLAIIQYPHNDIKE